MGKSILGRQNSMDKPILEKIKEGQYGQSIESKRKSGTRWSYRRGVQRQDHGELLRLCNRFQILFLGSEELLKDLN